MLVPVKTHSSYADFSNGRDVDSALHREDGSPGWTVGWLDDSQLAVTDERITPAEYSLLAADIKAYNAALPAPPPLPLTPTEARAQRISELLIIPRSDWTVAQYRELLQLVALEQIQ